MALRDIENFVRERMALVDPAFDTTPGSPFDVQVVQPLSRRLGTDPFTVDLPTFISARLEQAFPELATKEGDALTDMLNKPANLLFDPFTREIKRVGNNLSFRDPAILTLDEADSLGGTYFSPRRLGKLSRGVLRLYFSQPQNISITQVNYATSRGGLHFFPIELQSIRTQEMVLNQGSDGLYYFDVNVIAEKAGTEYDIGPNEIISIANVPAAVKVTNLRRFRNGDPEENAEEYVNRLSQSVSEKSMVTLRGISAKLLESFSEVNRLNVVGFNDPEMQRDVIKGGGLGPIIGAGTQGLPIPDGEAKAKTRRFSIADPTDFISLITGEAGSWVLTVFGAFGASPIAMDLTVRRVINATELDVEEQVMVYGATLHSWTLRKKEITLSGIPGGILFPDSQNGTVAIPDGEIHIGGCSDLHIRGTGFDEGTLAISNVTDDEPLLKGTSLEVSAGPVIQLNDLVLNGTYEEGSETFVQLENAAFFGYTLQILEGVDAGNYRIVNVVQTSGQPPELTVDPPPTNPGATLYRWRLFDVINVDLVDPRETKVEGDDLRTVQGSDIVDTTSGINYDELGVSEGDTLRILDGPDAGDYRIDENPLAPSFEKLRLDRVIEHSGSNLQYVIFRPNEAGGILRPLIRATKIELLDSSNQTVGSVIPYAKPVDIQSRAFQNPSRGIKHDFRDVRLGLVSRLADPGNVYPTVAGQTLTFLIGASNYTVTISTTNATVTQVVSQINAQIFALAGIPAFAVQITDEYFGIRPVDPIVYLRSGTARTAIFGNEEFRSTLDVRSATVEALGPSGWLALSPEIDFTTRLDILQVLDGANIGYYEAPYILNALPVPGPTPSTALLILSTDKFFGFAPEVDRRVQIGARSLGSARVYFMSPTSFEVDDDARFKVTTDAGELEFIPDPTLRYQRVPPLPSNDVPQDGSSAQFTNTFTSTSQDFTKSQVRPGDILVIKNHPIAGTVVLADPVVGLVNQTFVFSLDGGPDRTLTFIRDDVSLNANEVSRAGVAEQINAAAGEDICQLTVGNTLEFDTVRDLVIRKDGTANPTILGNVAGTVPTKSFITADQSNVSPFAGEYEIQTIGSDTLVLQGPFGAATPFASPVTRQSFTVLRRAVQRITTTSMAENVAEAGLYYFDVELISLGTGDQWNIDRGLQMTAEGYRSDGFYLTTKDPNTTYSTIEDVQLVLSRTILEVGVDDDPSNATQISGQNIQITYDRMPTVTDVQNFASSDIERVVCSSPLARHLTPHFVRFDVNYVGGSRESVVRPDVEKYIRDIFPNGALESSDVQKIISNRGAQSITNPIDLIALVYNFDRSVYAARSQNALTTGRLAAFIPDVLNITRGT